MKKILSLFAIILVFTTCKKDKKIAPVTLLDVTGTWTLYSWDDNAYTNINATVSDYPCMSENVLTINPDQTTHTNYIGTDTCYVTHDLRAGGSGLRGTAIGLPGEASSSSTWHRNGNDVYVGNQLYRITSENGRLLLTYRDTVTINGTQHFLTTVDVKQ
ncbi:MAG TPA: hypothetical protein VFE54_00355 [Mucilaginibacter sp.]|jgi:hypothetical protein|nr:hypothetical protein [Mucilaginibacter sp.]